MRKRIMKIAVIILIIVALVVVWFLIPYSPLKSSFGSDVEGLKLSNITEENRPFSKSDFSEMPEPIQKYIEHCGYIGTPQMNYLKMEYKDVDFLQSRKGPALKMDYTQYNFVAQPARMALIDSSMFGIPFEGYDYYQNGEGGMKGVIAKSITLFDQKGKEMDQACLVTFLAESLFAPSILLQDYIAFEEIDAYHVRADISYGGAAASGVFTFNEDYEYISFTTNDRAAANSDGSVEYIPWTAECKDYHRHENGIKYPAKFSAIWHYSPNEDFVYFDGVISSVEYGFE